MAVFLVLTGSAWLMATPPGGAPDEGAHYLKALGAGGGDLYGRPLGPGRSDLGRLAELDAAQRAALARVVVSEQVRWQRRTSRVFDVPAGLGFDAFGCNAARPDASAACLQRGQRSRRATATPTYTGTYQPYVYVVPGVLMRAGGSPHSAMRLGRVGIAVLCLGLLVLAAGLVADRSRVGLPLAGLLAAITPASVFLSSTLNPSGPEITGAICFCAALLRLSRREEHPAWVWAALSVSGAVLAVSRSLGAAFVVAIIGSVALLVGPRRLLAAGRAAPRAGAAATAVIALAIAAGLGWELAAQPHPGGTLAGLAGDIEPAAGRLGRIAQEAVGIFGVLDAPAPWAAYIAWFGLVGGLLIGAAVVSGRGERARLGLTALGLIAAVIVFSTVYRRTGFEVQGRYVLPLLVVLPLGAAELLDRKPRRMQEALARRLLVGAAALTAGVHFVSWWASARRAAVGTDGPWLFLGSAEWSPPGGWALWAVVAGLGAGCAVLAGVVASRSGGAQPGRRASTA